MEQITILEVITRLINKRKEKRKVPHCALIDDVIKLSGMSKEEVMKEVRKLKEEGKIAIRETINSQSFYLR